MLQEIKIAKMVDWVNKGRTPSTVFNKFQLKTMQKAILNCLEVSDVVANLPTGFGKSLLFQYPASLQKVNINCILVIVPLKALLWDTIRQARQLNIIAEQIDNNSIHQYYRNQNLPQMLVATPQKIFASQGTLNFIQSLYSQKKIRLLVIDQCHCMCQWGHDFRPAYLQLQKLRQMLTGVRLLAISATITPDARIDLSKRLHLYTAHYFQASYHRSNLFYGIINCKGKDQIKNAIRDYLKQKKLQDQSGIIYCQTIAVADSLAKQLSHLKVGLFHSKLSQNLRKQTYDGFIQGRIKAIVGTICFGMGINKKDIRYVINVGISKSPQNYYQQSGRAGRDGLEAQCIIVSFPNQTNSLNFLISKSNVNNKLKTHQLLKLQQIKQYAEQQCECRRTILFRKLGQNFNPQNCGQNCDICRNNTLGIKIKKTDYYPQAKKILQQLQASKKYFTKKQLCNYLKGKTVNKCKSKKEIQLILGQQIKGFLSKQTMETIQKFVDEMVKKNIIIPDVRSFNSKFNVNYYKPANKNSTKNFKQFTIYFKQKQLKKQKSSSKLQISSNRFQKFLQKKGAVQTQKKTMTLSEMVPKKVENEGLVQAQVIKSKQNYQAFFCQLFGQDLNTRGGEKRQQSIQQASEPQQQNIIDIQKIPDDLEQQPMHLQQINVEEQQNKNQMIQIQKILLRQFKQEKEQPLKRNKLNPQKLSNITDNQHQK